MKTREILFKGKRVNSSDWEFGSLYENHIIRNLSIDNDGVGGMYTIIPKSVGQFIGLTDKNGVKIFEGDIVETDGSVSFSNYDSGKFSKRQIISSDCGFVGIRIGNQFDMDHNSSAHIWGNYQLWNIARSLTVIGNTHDNPELS